MTVRPTIPALASWAVHNLMLPPEYPDERQRALVALPTFTSERTGRSDIGVRIEDGSIVNEILRVAVEWLAQLIALGTHGASGVDRLSLGSVTERVVRRSHIPVDDSVDCCGTPRRSHRAWRGRCPSVVRVHGAQRHTPVTGGRARRAG